MRSLLFATLIAAALPATALFDNLWSGDDTWSPHADVVGRWGNYRQGAGVALFAPVSQDGNSIFFGQALGGWFREHWTGTIGGGYRSLLSNRVAWGANAFFDVARATTGNVYYQGGIGAELFGNCWDARVNGYFPTRNLHKKERLRSLPNGTALVNEQVTERELGYLGFDIEGGYGMELWCGQLWGHLAYFYYNRDHVDEIQGPRLRADYRFANLFMDGSEVILGAEYEWNQLHGNTVSGYASIRIPLIRCASRLSASCCNSLCRQMGDRVYRNNTIWVDRQVKRRFDPTLASLFFVAEFAGAGGVGTQTDPMNLADADAITDPNANFFLLDDNGGINVISTWTLTGNQRVFGFGVESAVTVDPVGAAPITVTDLTGAGRGVLASGGPDIIEIATNNVIQGIGLLGNGAQDGIIAPDGGSVLVSKTAFSTLVNGVFADQTAVGTSLDVVVLDSAFDTITTNGVAAVNNSAIGSPMNVRVERSQFLATATGVAVEENSAGGSSNAVVADNIMLATTGIAVSTGTAADGSTYTFDVRGNRVSGGTNAITGAFTSAGGTAIAVDGLIRSNPTLASSDSATGVINIATDLALAGDTVTVSVQDNPLIDNITEAALVGTFDSFGTANLTVIRNVQTNTPPTVGNAGYSLTTLGTFAGTLCSTVGGTPTNTANANSTDNGGGTMGIFLTHAAGTWNANGANGPNLNAANNFIGVTEAGVGTILFQGDGFTCPLPVVP